jgi:hypothetical protein
MKPEYLYQELKDLAEKMAVTVSEQNLRTAGIKVKSGLCTVKGADAQLASMPSENVYVVPAVRELLDKHSAKSKSE